MFLTRDAHSIYRESVARIWPGIHEFDQWLYQALITRRCHFILRYLQDLNGTANRYLG